VAARSSVEGSGTGEGENSKIVPRSKAPPNSVVPKRLPWPSMIRSPTGNAPLLPLKLARAVMVWLPCGSS
jgi:hypothetical protein